MTAALAALPGTARLAVPVDPDGLLRDLVGLAGETWGRVGRGGDPAAELGWTTLALRSPGGDPARTDPGGAGLVDFADTPRMARCPNIARLLQRLPVRIRSVRLMALAPGAASHRHVDPAYNPAGGTVRLHAPLVTGPGAVLEIDGGEQHWPAGALWYADFAREHRVRNQGDRTRVHLVVDTHVSRELLALFPDPFRDPALEPCIVFDTPRGSAHLAADVPDCTFEMPSGVDGTRRGPVPAGVIVTDGTAVLHIGGEPRFGLVPTGRREFRLAGWTCAQLLRLRPEHGEVVLVARAGGRAHEVRRPARFSSTSGRSCSA